MPLRKLVSPAAKSPGRGMARALCIETVLSDASGIGCCAAAGGAAAGCDREGSGFSSKDGVNPS